MNQRILDVLHHELRTPLALVADYADRLVLATNQIDNQEQFAEFLNDLTQDSQQLVQVVEDLSLVAQIHPMSEYV